MSEDFDTTQVKGKNTEKKWMNWAGELAGINWVTQRAGVEN